MPRRAHVGDNRHRLPGAQQADDALDGLLFVVFVVGDLVGFDIEMGQQTPSIAGILRRDHIHRAQSFQGAQSDVVQMADGCGDEVEHQAACRCLSRWALAISTLTAASLP